MKSTDDHMKSGRRNLLKFVAAIPLLVVSAKTALAHKMTQAAARYQGTPKAGQNCANCKYFTAPNRCTIVEGNISPNGWCVLWAKK